MAKERVELFLARRIAPRRGERSGAMTSIARLCIAVCIAVMLVALSVISGFKDAMHQQLTGLEAHITVEPSGSYGSLEELPLTLNADFEAKVAEFDHFISITPFTSRAGIVKSIAEALGSNLAAEQCARSGYGDFDEFFIMLTAERGGCRALAGEEFFKLSKLFLNEELHILVDVHLSANYANFHLAFLAFLSVL